MLGVADPFMLGVADPFSLGCGCTAFRLPRFSAVGLFAALKQETLCVCGISLCVFVVFHFVFLWQLCAKAISSFLGSPF